MSEERWNVLVTEEMDPTGPEALADIATVYWPDDYPDAAAMRDDIDRFHAIIVRTFEASRDLLERAENLRIVSKHGIGLDNVDVEAATGRGVVVANLPGAISQEVAEHALALLLAVGKRVVVADGDVRSGVWERGRYAGRTLGEQVLGVFGVGDIGVRMTELCRGLGMDCVAYDPYVEPEAVPDGVELVGSPAELFDRADAVSVHAPLTDETRGAVSTDEFERLGEAGVLVNTARGGVVDEGALIDALETGTIAGAGLDVFEREPPAPDNPLFALDSVVLTPHVAGGTVDSLRRLSRRAADNVRRVHDGERPEATVNPDVYGR